MSQPGAPPSGARDRRRYKRRLRFTPGSAAATVFPRHSRRRRLAFGVGWICGGTRAWVCPRSPSLLGLPSLAFFRVGTIARAAGWCARLAQIGRSRPLDTIRNNSRNCRGVSRRQPQPRLLLPTPLEIFEGYPISLVFFHASGLARQPPPPPPWRAQQAAADSWSVGCGVCAAATGRTFPTQRRRRARFRAPTSATSATSNLYCFSVFGIFFFHVMWKSCGKIERLFYFRTLGSFFVAAQKIFLNYFQITIDFLSNLWYNIYKEKRLDRGNDQGVISNESRIFAL